MKYFCSILITAIILYACNDIRKETKSTAPVSDLCHIDLIVDTATWFAIKNDSFFQKEFAVLESDTAYYGGKPSYDLYMLGQLDFLHISQAKGFWANQEGSGVLVFQTQKPGMKDSVVAAWKQFYKDSLYEHTYKGSDFTLEEVMPWHKSDSTKLKEPSIFPNLTSYSADAYKNWGITDSIINAGLSMKQFMANWGGKELESKLYDAITELHLTINAKEFTEMRSALLATGYTENNKIFTHSFNPAVYITILEEKGKPKYSKVKLKLTRSVEEKEIIFSPTMTLKLNGNEGWLILN
ncbi:MAG: DUF5829 family protein [Chitinophagaceae bacterium]